MSLDNQDYDLFRVIGREVTKKLEEQNKIMSEISESLLKLVVIINRFDNYGGERIEPEDLKIFVASERE